MADIVSTRIIRLQAISPRVQADDTVLLISQKAGWIAKYATILAEQAGLDAQATALGITTEKTAYDAAITALTAYLATLLTPVPWNDLSNNTTIVGADFRAAFSLVDTTKQALLNAMISVSGADGDPGPTGPTGATGAAGPAGPAGGSIDSAFASTFGSLPNTSVVFADAGRALVTTTCNFYNNTGGGIEMSARLVCNGSYSPVSYSPIEVGEGGSITISWAFDVLAGTTNVSVELRPASWAEVQAGAMGTGSSSLFVTLGCGLSAMGVV